MTAYGRLYQQADDIRRKLIDLIPETQRPTGPRMNRVEDAIREVAQHAALCQQLLSEWARLEREMAKEPNE